MYAGKSVSELLEPADNSDTDWSDVPMVRMEDSSGRNSFEAGSDTKLEFEPNVEEELESVPNSNLVKDNPMGTESPLASPTVRKRSARSVVQDASSSGLLISDEDSMRYCSTAF